MNVRICHVHGDTFAACKGQPHPSRTLWCDGQGTYPDRRVEGRKYATCWACTKLVSLRANGTIRAHNGRGR